MFNAAVSQHHKFRDSVQTSQVPHPEIELSPAPGLQEVPAVSFFSREDVIFLYLLAGQ